MSISRVIHIGVVANAAAGGTVIATGTVQSPYTGFITTIEIVLPESPIGKLQYAIVRNSEHIYPENGYAQRSLGGMDYTEMYTQIIEGDNISLIVLNNDELTPYEIIAKITIQKDVIWETIISNAVFSEKQ